MSETIELLKELEKLEKKEKKKQGGVEVIKDVLVKYSMQGNAVSIRGIQEEVGFNEMYVREKVMQLYRDVVFEYQGKTYLVMRKMMKGKYYYWCVDVTGKKIDIEMWKQQRKSKSVEVIRIK